MKCIVAAELLMFPDVMRISSLYRMNIKFVDTRCAYMVLQYNAWFDLQALCMSGYSNIQ